MDEKGEEAERARLDPWPSLIREKQKDISRLGPIGIIREAFQLFLSHFKFFVLVQIFLMLPLMVFAVASENLIYQIVNSHFREIVDDPNWGIDAFLIYMLFSAAVFPFGFLIYEASIGLSSSVILYAVGLHYTGHSVSFKDALHASHDGLCMRLTTTNFYRDSQLYIILTVGAIISGVGILLQNQVLMVLMFGMSLVFLFAAIGFYDIVFFLAAGMAVLEKDFDWRRVPWSRILSLLEGREHVAVLFELLSWVPIISLPGFQLAFGVPYQITQKSPSPGNLAASILCIVFYVGLRSFLWQMKAVCGGVQYLSFKAYQEGLAVKSISRQSLKGTYELVASESGDPEGGLKQADTFVQTDASV